MGTSVPTSSCSGLDHPASGLVAVTTHAISMACLITCALVAFAPAPCVNTVSLATAINSLPLYPTGTLQLWITFLRYQLFAQSLLKKLPFKPQHTLTVRFRVLFTSFSGFFSVFPRGTIPLSVSELYLELEVADSRFPGGILTPSTLETTQSHLLAPTGLWCRTIEPSPFSIMKRT